MSDQKARFTYSLARQLRALFAQFSVRDDQAAYDSIDSNIRSMVEFKGTKLWVLMFAIIVASAGLNMNSVAVIIGALLISPLMGPIMGIGYGIGINDFELIKKAIKNISLAVITSILSAALYFLITPLSEARSELLAYTSPTFWDVLIALFCGLAGILSVTRKEKSNVISGVAIATSLMPPLCAAGYGLAIGSPAYFFGGFYLFFINMVFIALATVLFVGYLKPPQKHFVDAALERRVRFYIVSLVLITVLPSIYLAYDMVTDVAFNSRARDFIKNEMAFDNTFVTQTHISHASREIEVSLVGDEISKEQLAAIEKRLKYYTLENVKLGVHQSSSKNIDIASLKAALLKDLYGARPKTGEEKDTRVRVLESELAKIRAEQPDAQNIARELHTLYPSLQRLALAKTPLWRADGSAAENALIAYLEVSKAIPGIDQQKIIAWLKVRTKTEEVRLLMDRTLKSR